MNSDDRENEKLKKDTESMRVQTNITESMPETMSLIDFNKSVVADIIKRQEQKLLDEAHAYLRKCAADSIYYVALGNALKRELAEKYGIDDRRAGDLLSVAAVNLVDMINANT